MEHTVREEGGRCIVALSGEVDLEQSPKARQVLLDAVERSLPVLVDLEAVSYMDSSGIASLVESFQRAKKHSVEFSLVCVNPSVLRVLNLARLDKVFTIHETVEQALNANV
ncbi:MAG: STAS domain-containing protein [Nitrospirota bacterium]|nr:STAS domain-containing protein [Nitrospirota bacterium]